MYRHKLPTIWQTLEAIRQARREDTNRGYDRSETENHSTVLCAVEAPHTALFCSHHRDTERWHGL